MTAFAYSAIRKRVQDEKQAMASPEAKEAQVQASKEIKSKKHLLACPDVVKEQRKGGSRSDTKKDPKKDPKRDRNVGAKTQTGKPEIRFQDVSLGADNSIIKCTPHGRYIDVSINQNHPFYDTFYRKTSPKIQKAISLWLGAMAMVEVRYTQEEDQESVFNCVKHDLDQNLRRDT